MRLVDVQMGFPNLLLALVVLYAAGPSFKNVVLVLALTRWMVMARLTRAMALSLRESPYIEAARVLGASNSRLVRQHVVPNILAPLIVLTTLYLSSAILSEAALSFLGLGTQPPEPTWGGMLNIARTYMEISPWMAIFPGLAIAILVLGFNFLGDGLRDILDPRLRER
jgi:ABC-type dipeptide/oligopeptide/nickel transport system permease subunit